MELFILLFLLRISSVASEIHSLKYFSTRTCGGSNIPEFVVDGFVDDVQITHYDSNTRRLVPKQDWMNKITEDDPKHWDIYTERSKFNEEEDKEYIEIIKQSFNQTGGRHIVQKMFGCEWSNETDEVKGFEQHGYDGEDFISYDQKTKTWITKRPQADDTKHKWESNQGFMAYKHHYLTRECSGWLKIFFNYGKSPLMRKERPPVFLLQKTPSSPVTCHATGFYPDGADLFWRKDEEELHEGVVRGEILPNPDGTFQMSVDLDISLIESEDWRRFSCVFHLAGVQEDVLTPLDKSVIMTNRRSAIPTGVGVGVVGLLLLTIPSIIGFFLWRIKRRQLQASESSSPSGDEEVKKWTCEEQNMLEMTSDVSKLEWNLSGSLPDRGTSAHNLEEETTGDQELFYFYKGGQKFGSCHKLTKQIESDSQRTLTPDKNFVQCTEVGGYIFVQQAVTG